MTTSSSSAIASRIRGLLSGQGELSDLALNGQTGELPVIVTGLARKADTPTHLRVVREG